MTALILPHFELKQKRFYCFLLRIIQYIESCFVFRYCIFNCILPASQIVLSLVNNLWLHLDLIWGNPFVHVRMSSSVSQSAGHDGRGLSTILDICNEISIKRVVFGQFIIQGLM